MTGSADRLSALPAAHLTIWVDAQLSPDLAPWITARFQIEARASFPAIDGEKDHAGVAHLRRHVPEVVALFGIFGKLKGGAP